jgi:molybdopterin synthase sulfur carrier subunit
MIRVLFFGATAAASGTRELTLDNAEPINASELFDQVRRSYPALESHQLLFAVNQAYAVGDEVVRDGDEVAVFTAVSGG